MNADGNSPDASDEQLLAWAVTVARLVEIGKTLSDAEREQFQQELRSGDSLAMAVASEIRRFKSGRWGTQAMHDDAVRRLKEHAEYKRLWAPIKGHR